MRIYARDQVCSFRFTRAGWGAFSNFQPLAVPIAAGPWTFPTSEHAYQACKFPARPDVQQRIAEAPTAREAAAIGRTPGLGIDPRLEPPARRRHALGAAHEARGQRDRDRRGARRDRRPAHRRGLDARSVVGRSPRRGPLRGQERPRTALDGAAPAASRPRPRGPLRRLARPNPRRSPRRRHCCAGHHSRSRLTTVAPLSRRALGVSASRTPSVESGDRRGAVRLPRGVRAAPFPSPFGARP